MRDGERDPLSAAEFVDQGMRESTRREGAHTLRALLSQVGKHVEECRQALDFLQRVLADSASCGKKSPDSTKRRR